MDYLNASEDMLSCAGTENKLRGQFVYMYPIPDE